MNPTILIPGKILLGLAIAMGAPAGAALASDVPASVPLDSRFGAPARIAEPEERIEVIEPHEIDRTVVVTPRTRWVNVTGGETIRFVFPQADEAQSFVWRFDTTRATSFDLGEIAPQGALDRELRVYVAADPAYRS
jgi:hypothetical protein